jgi:hypothetical protein
VPIEPRDLFPPDVAPVTCVHATIANTPVDFRDALYVVVDAFDGGAQQWGPCRWVPADTIPHAGDECMLVLAEDDRAPWVLTHAGSGSSDHLDGGAPDSIYGGTDMIDGGGI